jgi:molybdate transport repressor ModE-like protein
LVKVKLAFKIWLESDEGYVFGEGPFNVLQKISELGTLRRSTEDLGMSYRYAWGLIKEIEHNLGVPLLKTHKGGVRGGGGSVLTDEAQELLKKYQLAEKTFLEISHSLNAELASS